MLEKASGENEEKIFGAHFNPSTEFLYNSQLAKTSCGRQTGHLHVDACWLIQMVLGPKSIVYEEQFWIQACVYDFLCKNCGHIATYGEDTSWGKYPPTFWDLKNMLQMASSENKKIFGAHFNPSTELLYQSTCNWQRWVGVMELAISMWMFADLIGWLQHNEILWPHCHSLGGQVYTPILQ